MATRIETQRLVIRTFTHDCAEPWLTMVTDPIVGRFLPPNNEPITLDTFKAMLDRRHKLEERVGHAMWAVERKDTGAFLGQCGIFPYDNTPEIELGYHYLPAVWGQGYATEAVIGVLGHGLGTLGLEQIMALIVPANVASCRVAEKAGMRLEPEPVTYYEMSGLRKYVADRTWSKPPAPKSAS